MMALRAGALRQVTGIVITASHNPEQDNGVKLVDPNGNMLDSRWEVNHSACPSSSAASQKLLRGRSSAYVDASSGTGTLHAPS